MSYFDKLNNDYMAALQDTHNSKCVFLGCNDNAIHSHITSKKIFERIAIEGHVYWIKKGEKPWGTNKAYTYPVFCSKHDQEIFKRLDNEDYKLEDKEQQFLYFYRTYAGELARQKKKIEHIENKGYYSDGKSIMGLCRLPKFLQNDYELLNNKFNELTQNLLTKEYNTIESLNIVFDKAYPVCVGQYLSLSYDFYGRPIPNNYGISLVVFPQNSKTNVIISWFKEDSNKLEFIHKILLGNDENSNKILLSMLILNGCTNIVFGIDYWDSLKAELKDKITYLYGLDCIEEEISLFIDTANTNTKV